MLLRIVGLHRDHASLLPVVLWRQRLNGSGLEELRDSAFGNQAAATYADMAQLAPGDQLADAPH